MKKRKLKSVRYDKAKDKKKRAKLPGRRVSKKDKVYYEYRRNRTDKHGWNAPKRYNGNWL